MHLAVKHNLEIYSTMDGLPGDDAAMVLPVRDAETAFMGETVIGFLARAGWRFDLPTICIINGECYGRAEWPTRALALNDNIEFISRPLGSGSGSSTAKSIASVLALVALTAVAGPAGPLGAALATSFGTAMGAFASAAIIGAAAAPLTLWLAPPVPWWRQKLKAARDSLRGALAVASRFWSSAQ